MDIGDRQNQPSVVPYVPGEGAVDDPTIIEALTLLSNAIEERSEPQVIRMAAFQVKTSAQFAARLYKLDSWKQPSSPVYRLLGIAKETLEKQGSEFARHIDKFVEELSKEGSLQRG